MKAFFLFCALLGSFFMANAQTNNNKVTVFPPNAMKAVKAPNNSVDGTYTSEQSGVTIKWSISYNTIENKISSMTFEQSGELSPERFNNGIQAMTMPEFWNGVLNCIGNPGNSCLFNLAMDAMADCRNAIGTPNQGAHCWMHE